MGNKPKKDYPTLELKCLKCDEIKEIPQKQKHVTNVCLDCQRARQREYAKIEAERDGRRPGVMGRRPYPLRDGHKTTGPLFKAMASKTFKCKTKEEWRALMGERLENVFQNDELSYWIFAHNEDKPKKRNKPKPDTRNITWEEWEARGWGDEEDS